eukprot:GHVT01079878.1.p1 GENE.GHVT01079878.1~~GHVT01079878.1.p1  ORF type:complete len:260 (-),score=65.11 GHVT01079878.1:1346-2125(-)
MPSSCYTCGAFSPVRCSEFLLGRQDGAIECWLLFEQTHQASSLRLVSSSAIACLVFAGPAWVDEEEEDDEGDGSGAPTGAGRRARRLDKAKQDARTAPGKTGPGTARSAQVTASSVSGWEDLAAAVAADPSRAPEAPGSATALRSSGLLTDDQADTGTGLKSQLVAVGDSGGNLHILTLNRPLAASQLRREKKFMLSFIKEEVARVAFVTAQDGNQSPQGNIQAEGVQKSAEDSSLKSQELRAALSQAAADLKMKGAEP